MSKIKRKVKGKERRRKENLKVFHKAILMAVTCV